MTRRCSSAIASSAASRLLVAISACASMIWISAGVWRELHRAPQRRDRLGGLAAFQQRLALEFVEIGVVAAAPGSGRRSAPMRHAQIAEAVGRDRARITRRQAVVAAADSGARPVVRPVEEAVQLGAHQVVAQLQRRRVLLVPVRAGLAPCPPARRRARAGIGCDCRYGSMPCASGTGSGRPAA